MEYGALITDLEDIDPAYLAVAECIGLEAFIKLCDRFGGGRMYIPAAYTLAQKPLAKAIKRDYEGGGKVIDIARKYSVSERTVHKAVKQ